MEKEQFKKWWDNNGQRGISYCECNYKNASLGNIRRWVQEFKGVTNPIGRHKQVKPLTMIVGGCFHYPHHDPEFISCFLQVMDYIKPDECILLGDIKDNAYHSLHSTSLESLRLEARKGKKGFKSFLEQFVSRTKVTRYIRGNHEAWIDAKKELDITLLEDDDFTVPKELGFDDLNILYYPEFYEYKGFMFEHGNYLGNSNSAAQKQMLDEFKSGISVHLHREGEYRHTTREKEFVWHILGCGCKLKMWYSLKGKPRFRSGWNQSFAIIKFIDDRFEIIPIRVIKGKCIFDGKLFDGSKKYNNY